MKTSLENEIKSGLQGDEQRQHDALCSAYNRYAGPLTAFLRERWGVTLDGHEIATVVNDVFIELAKKASTGNFKANGSLPTLLFTMAKCNAKDLWDKKSRYQRRHIPDCCLGEDLTEDEVAALVAKKLAEASEVAAAWKSLAQQRTPADEAGTEEIVRQFRIWLGTLPRLQRKVAELIAIHYGNITDEGICDALGQAGFIVALGSVKSARREIREKFTSLIQRQERVNTP